LFVEAPPRPEVEATIKKREEIREEKELAEKRGEAPPKSPSETWEDYIKKYGTQAQIPSEHIARKYRPQLEEAARKEAEAKPPTREERIKETLAKQRQREYEERITETIEKQRTKEYLEAPHPELYPHLFGLVRDRYKEKEKILPSPVYTLPFYRKGKEPIKIEPSIKFGIEKVKEFTPTGIVTLPYVKGKWYREHKFIPEKAKPFIKKVEKGYKIYREKVKPIWREAVGITPYEIMGAIARVKREKAETRLGKIYYGVKEFTLGIAAAPVVKVREEPVSAVAIGGAGLVLGAIPYTIKPIVGKIAAGAFVGITGVETGYKAYKKEYYRAGEVLGKRVVEAGIFMGGFEAGKVFKTKISGIIKSKFTKSEKLTKIRNLYERAGTEGERQAALRAYKRLGGKVEDLPKPEKVITYKKPKALLPPKKITKPSKIGRELEVIVP